MNKKTEIKNIIEKYMSLISANLDYIGSDFVDLSFKYDDDKGDLYVDAIHGKVIRATIDIMRTLDDLKTGL